MLEEEAGVMRNAMTTRAPCGAKNALSDISFYWPKDQESSLGNMNFQNLIFPSWKGCVQREQDFQGGDEKAASLALATFLGNNILFQLGCWTSENQNHLFYHLM